MSTTAAVELLNGARAHTAILVEGWSDQAALEALARRRDLDLRAEGIGVVPIGGITNVGKFTEALGPRGVGGGPNPTHIQAVWKVESGGTAIIDTYASLTGLIVDGLA